MLIRTLDQVAGTPFDVDHGNSVSRRLVVAADERGYTVTDTVVRPGTTSLMRYERHLESCYCVEGEGVVRVGDHEWSITAGTLYAPDRNEEHWLSTDSGLRLVCVFAPALNGDERHSFDANRPSSY